MKTRRFIAMWDMYGLEALFDVDKHLKEFKQWEQEKIWSTLQEKPVKPKPPGIPLRSMILRAQVNHQRFYEIYEFKSNVPEKDIRESFESNPQSLVDWIRENGDKIYSGRSSIKEPVIL